MPDLSNLYRSPQGRAALMAWYDRALARLETPYTTHWAATHYGATHVISAGPAAAPPVVLLHGLNANALAWSRQIDALASEHRVYAIDILGLLGRSAAVRLPYDGRAYVDWLRQTLDALALPQASFVGMAFGAWLSLRLAALAPERVTRVALLSPAGFLPVRWKYLVPMIWDVWFINDEQARRLAHRLLAPAGTPLDDQAVELLYLALKHATTQAEAPALSPQQLGAVTAPTLALVGEQEDLWPPRELLSQIRLTLPNLRAAEAVPGAGHGLTASHSPLVNARLLRFLRDEA